MNVATAHPLRAAPSQINTPDRRARVFVSSTLGELAEERQAVRAAITSLRLTPIMFETGARHHPARDLYRAYLQQSDIFVGIYWQKYGWVAPGETVSGLEDEYRLAGERPKLIYVKSADTREPRLAELLNRLKTDDQVSYKHFASAAELADLVADDVAILLTESLSSRRIGALDLEAPRLPTPPTDIVGREDELSKVAALLDDPAVRLITLSGPGGIGKTRLALEAAAAVSRTPASRFEGVWFVDLTATSDPGLVLQSVGAALGIRQQGTAPLIEVLSDRLTGRQILLVLDNFEQVMSAAPVLAALLAACSTITVLVTSRSVLRIRGEREVSIAPLATPPAGTALDLDAIARSAAVRLFVARGRQVRDTFILNAANADAVAELCRRLDGVPLALELAAAQLRLLTPQALLRLLAARLDRTLDLGSGPVDLPARQQTLRATIEWSYELLPPAEQSLLARLSVFVGPWDWDSANAVGSDTGDVDVLSAMSSLVAQSLVSADELLAGEPAFTMFDTVRAFAQEKLEERGEHEASMARLTAYFRDFAARAGEGLERPGNQRWTARVATQLDDLLNVMTHAIAADDAETVIRISAPLFTYWWSHDRLGQMRELAGQAAALPSAQQLSPDTAALLLWGRGMFEISAGHIEQAEPLLQQLLRTANVLGDIRLRAHALTGLGVAVANDDVARGRLLLDEAVTSFGSQDDRWGLSFALLASGLLALRDGDLQAATITHARALEVADQINNIHLRAQLSGYLGLDALAVGDLDGARQHLADAAAMHTQLLDQEGSAYCLDGLAAMALTQGRAYVAAQLLAAADHARTVLGVAVWPVMQNLAATLASAVEAALTPHAFAEATDAGARMRMSDALSWGLDHTAPTPLTNTDPESTSHDETTA